MKFSIIHPSYNRPDWAIKAHKDLMSKCLNFPDVEYIISLNVNEPRLYEYKQRLKPFPNIKLVVTNSTNCVQALNAGAKTSTGDILIYMSEDFVFPQDWDYKILKLVDPKMKDDWVMWPYDGYQDRLNIHCILSRKYYNRFGYIYHPEYLSMYADDEFTVVASLLKRMIDVRKKLTIKHEHYANLGKAPTDVTYQIQNDSQRFAKGKAIFEAHKAINFGLK